MCPYAPLRTPYVPLRAPYAILHTFSAPYDPYVPLMLSPYTPYVPFFLNAPLEGMWMPLRSHPASSEQFYPAESPFYTYGSRLSSSQYRVPVKTPRASIYLPLTICPLMRPSFPYAPAPCSALPVQFYPLRAIRNFHSIRGRSNSDSRRAPGIELHTCWFQMWCMLQ